GGGWVSGAPRPRAPQRPAAPGDRGRARCAGRALRAPAGAPASDDALRQHRDGHPLEAGDVRTGHIVAGGAVALGGLGARGVDVGHDPGQLVVDLVGLPRGARGVLRHLQGAHGDTARVGRLARAEGDPGLLEQLHGLGGGRHVRALGHRLHAVPDEGGGVLRVQLVLRRRGQRHVGRDLPDAPAGHEPGGAAPAFGVGAHAPALDLLDLAQQLHVDALLVDDVAAGVGAGDGVGAEGGQLLDGVDGDVAGAGDDRRLPLEVLAAHPQHRLGEQHVAVTGGLRPYQRAAPAGPLAGEHAALPAVGDAPVLAEEVADRAGADADVTGAPVGVVARVAVRHGAERLAEAHDLGVAAALRVEVAAALAAADAETGERVLEDLLEAQELDDPEVDRGVEAQAALVGAEGAVVFDPEAPVDVHATVVVLPRHPEDDLPLRLDQPLHEPRH